MAGIEKAHGGWKVQIYRQVFYTAEALQKILRTHNIQAEVIYAESPVAPGQLKHHYMPNIPLIIYPENISWETMKPLLEKN